MRARAVSIIHGVMTPDDHRRISEARRQRRRLKNKAIRLREQERRAARHTSKATKRGHIHQHRPAGSKIAARYRGEAEGQLVLGGYVKTLKHPGREA